MPATADLIHSVNRIPVLTKTPYIISFESHLPRYYGGEQTRMFGAMRRRLASQQCRRIIAFSEFAKRLFLATHGGTDEYSTLESKLEVIYPNLVLPSWNPKHSPEDVPLKLVFVGAHFGRKGGAVTVRAAEIARSRKLPIHFHIISSLIVGPSVWTDPKEIAFFEPYLRQLHADNVTFTRTLSNAEVISALREADLSILITLNDSFGYSAIESLAVGTPVLATSQGALPEFILDNENGFILPLPTDAYGDWVHAGRSDKDSRRFSKLYRDEIERLAELMINRLEPICRDRSSLESMRSQARKAAELRFDSAKTSVLLDQLYDASVGRS
jgi:glycosyltransferase involved in cell wall biosynthesis